MKRLLVALDPALAPWAPEVKYSLRSLLRIAGYGYDFTWSSQLSPSEDADVYYGNEEHVRAPVRISSGPQSFDRPGQQAPQKLSGDPDLPFLEFSSNERLPLRSSASALTFANDIVFATFWLLTGAGEKGIPRDRWDNLHAADAFIVARGLLDRPLVSLYGALLRKFFEGRGYEAWRPSWSSGPGQAAFSFTHDVDYPQMLRWIESLRLLRRRGARALPSIAGIWRGTNHFWKFADWIELERTYGARPAFYFMARQGSLWEYARGTPDAFYDVQSKAFQVLFPLLRDAGCEIGLHASYHAHRSAAQLRHEREVLERAAGVTVKGGRHHYWHLDPEDPHGTLLKHEQVGMRYDSSLGFEFFPGFRRGCCHPFRVFHTGERRELELVQLPPAWMDDHFDRRRVMNHITDSTAAALRLLNVARATGGVAIVDYHARGLNADFYPLYGPWLKQFAETHFDSTLRHATPAELCSEYEEYVAFMDRNSTDRTDVSEHSVARSHAGVNVSS